MKHMAITVNLGFKHFKCWDKKHGKRKTKRHFLNCFLF